jgi:hypothetical protein
VNGTGRLLADRLYDPRMSVAKSVYAQSCHEVEILLTFEVKEKHALAALKADGVTVVGRKKKALFQIDDLFEARHKFILERANNIHHGGPESRRNSKK